MLSEKIKKIAPVQEGWGIDVSIQDGMPFIDSKKKTILRLKMGSRLSLKNPVVISADPFLFVHKGWLFLFYEELSYYNCGGNIVMRKTKDLKHWSKPYTIIDDPHHYSFPYVFEDNGSVYMIPESGCNDRIRLYKADDDSLESFSLVKNLIEQDQRPKDVVFNYCDNVLYKKDGVYYLFTSKYDGDSYRLELYLSDKLEGPYSPHPASPVRNDSKYGRNGGSIIEYEGKLLRVAQDCSESYGGDIHLLEIDQLTPTSYNEHVFKDHVALTDRRYYRNGSHQLNFAHFLGKTIVATDAKGFRRLYLLKGWHKLLRGLSKC